jgi:glycosyltransferase involved in cell wall biosynthesis
MPERKIRVLQLIDSLVVGGAERVVLMLALNMNRERFEVIPCTLRGGGPLENDLKAAGIPYRILGIPRRSILSGPFFVVNLRQTLRALVETLRELSIDIIHAHLSETTLLSVLAGRRAGVRGVCATVHSVVMIDQRGRLSPREWLQRMAIDRMFARADYIIAVSNGVSGAIRSHTRIPWERILTIPNGVEPNPFALREGRHTLRRMLDLPHDRPLVVTVGRLTREKGHSYLQTALASIPASQRPLTLIVGDGPERDELESRNRIMGLAEDIRFLGHRRDVPGLLAAADLFVLPSLWEGLPLVLLEAMAAGLPAVVTAVGGNPEVVEDGVSGVLVPAGDQQALAAAMLSLLHNPLRRQQMGQAARQRFDRYFSLQRFIEAHERLYGEMLAQQQKFSKITA